MLLFSGGSDLLSVDSKSAAGTIAVKRIEFKINSAKSKVLGLICH